MANPMGDTESLADDCFFLDPHILPAVLPLLSQGAAFMMTSSVPPDDTIDSLPAQESQLMALLNATKEGRRWFVCHACNTLRLGDATYLPAHAWRSERPFCTVCVRYCPECDTQYAPDAQRIHTECADFPYIEERNS